MSVIKIKRQKYSTFLQIAVYLFLFNAMFKYFLPDTLTKLLPIVAVILALLKSNSALKVSINRIDKAFAIFLCIWILGVFYSTSISKGLGYVLSFATAFIFGILVWKKDLDEKKIIGFLTVSCTLLTTFVIIQPIMPELVSRINQLFSYSALEYSNMASWARNGWYSGLFPDRAPAAFYGSILIGTGLYFVYRNYKLNASLGRRFLGIIFIAIGVYGILLTSKRGLLVSAIFAAFVTFIVYKKAYQTAVWKIIIGVIVVAIVSLTILSTVDVAQTIILRFIESEDFTTGRIEIYGDIIDNILKNPIFGTGTASAFDILGIGGHNIYLTVFMENGVIGIVVFVFAVLYGLFCTIRDALVYGKNGFSETLPFLMFSLYVQVLFIINGLTGNPLYDNYILYFYLFSLLITKNAQYQYTRRMKALETEEA